MTHVISFRTAVFDPAGEPENPFNPIAGQSALVWVRGTVLGDDYKSTEPDCEDWGWYTEVSANDSTYTVGAICFEEDDDPVGASRDWMIQVVKRRTMSEALRRKNVMLPDDSLTRSIVDALEADPGFEDVALEIGR